MKARNSRRTPFNLIEITLAVAVLGFCSTGIFGLLSLALRTSTSSIAYNYAGATADNFLSFLESTAHNNWNAVVDNLPEPDARPDSDTLDAAIPDYSNPIMRDIYPNETGTPGIYFIRQMNAGVTDFAACAAIWKSPVTMAVRGDGSWTAIELDYDTAAVMNIELSWPLEKPYEKRDKEFMQIEIFQR